MQDARLGLSNSKIFAVTGHRPDKLDGYKLLYNGPKCKKIINTLHVVIDSEKPDYIISGMAQGVDTIWATLAIKNKIPLLAYIPHWDQPRIWPDRAKKTWQSLIDKAYGIVDVSDGAPWNNYLLQKRNEAMVNDCAVLIGVWDGTPGGTANCITYADQIRKKKIIFGL